MSEIIPLPENVRWILSSLQQSGFEAFAVGGCVRDTLIGRTPGDWDITTNALPEDIKKVFRHTVDTGIEHGTVTVIVYPEKSEGGEKTAETYEVTTYRLDGEYTDCRHPDRVTFTGELKEDLRRRDFTINAMAYNEETGLVDLFGGKKDLSEKRIRCVGDPSERFDEDALRILRAVRFAAQLGFSIEEKTAAAVRQFAGRLRMVSRERIYAEISKLFCSAHPEKASLLFELGLSEVIVPGFEKISLLQEKTDFSKYGAEKKYQRYAVFFRNLPEKEIRRLFRELKAENSTRDAAALLAPRIFRKLPEEKYPLKLFLSEMTPELFCDLLEIRKCLGRTEEYLRKCPGEDLEKTEQCFLSAMEGKEPVYIKDLAVNGMDLKERGIPEGPQMGKLLTGLLEEVRKDPEKNRKEILLQLAEERQMKSEAVKQETLP